MFYLSCMKDDVYIIKWGGLHSAITQQLSIGKRKLDFFFYLELSLEFAMKGT